MLKRFDINSIKTRSILFILKHSLEKSRFSMHFNKPKPMAKFDVGIIEKVYGCGNTI